jgi:hypothetical protein
MDRTVIASPEKLLTERLDQATSSLMASLRDSKALNSQIYQALQSKEQENAFEPLEAARDPGDGLSKLLREILRGMTPS